MLIPFPVVVDEETRRIVPFLPDIPERNERSKNRLIADRNRTAVHDIMRRIVTGQHQRIKTLPPRFAVVIIPHTEFFSAADHIHDVRFQIKIRKPADPLISLFIFITERDLIKIEYILPAAPMLCDQQDLASHPAQPLLCRTERLISAVKRSAVTAEAIDTCFQDPFHEPGGKPFIEFFVFPVEQPPGIRSVIVAEPFRFLLPERTAALMFGDSPVDNIEKDPDITFMRFVNKRFQHLPLPFPRFLAGQERADRMNSEIAVSVAAVQRRSQPDPVHSGFRQMIQYGDQPLYRPIGRCRVNTDLCKDQAFHPVGRLRRTIRPTLHTHFGVRLVRRQQ